MEDEYFGEDGKVYCKKCNTSRVAVFDARFIRCKCQCQMEQIEKKYAEPQERSDKE